MTDLEKTINQAIKDFDDIEKAIEEKGVEVPYDTNTSQYGNLIRSIPVGDSSEPLVKELNLNRWEDLDDINHRTIDCNGACNLLYRGTINVFIPYVLLVQIATEDVPRTFQTIWIPKSLSLEFEYLNRSFGAEFGGLDSDAKWSKWVSLGGSNEAIGDIDSALEEIIKIQNQLMGVSE